MSGGLGFCFVFGFSLRDVDLLLTIVIPLACTAVFLNERAAA